MHQPESTELNSANKDKVRNIVRGQKVTASKHQFAKELRKNMTPAETILWKCLRANKINGLRFRRQQIISGFIADFYCHSVGLVIEVDGLIHEKRKEYDAERDRIFTDRGLRVLRVKNEDVFNNLDGVIDAIAQACITTLP